jgi:hypothetical protein
LGLCSPGEAGSIKLNYIYQDIHNATTMAITLLNLAINHVKIWSIHHFLQFLARFIVLLSPRRSFTRYLQAFYEIFPLSFN